MNTLDIILGILLLFFIYKGFTQGFVIGLATLVGLVAGIWFAVHYAAYATHLLRDVLHLHTSHMALASFIFTFLAVLILVFLLGRVLTGIINLLALGLVNRLAGALFGIVKGGLILSALLYVFVSLDAGGKFLSQSQRQQSKLYKPIAAIFPALLPLLKETLVTLQEPVADPRTKKHN
jgi:membrane protein required for colicin V production